MHHLVQKGLGIAAEGFLAAEQFVEDDAQGIDVRAAVGAVRIAAGLFGRHVGRCAEDFAFERHTDFAGIVLGQAEIEQVGFAAGIDDDVRRLQVAMDDAGLVGVVEGIGDLLADARGLLEGEGMDLDPIVELGTVDKVADDEDTSADVADLVHGDDARMVQAGGCAGLA